MCWKYCWMSEKLYRPWSDATDKCPGGRAVRAPDFGSQGPMFASCWRRNSALDCVALHCIEPFIITFPSSRYDLNNVDRYVKHKIIIWGSVECDIWSGCALFAIHPAIFYFTDFFSDFRTSTYNNCTMHLGFSKKYWKKMCREIST